MKNKQKIVCKKCILSTKIPNVTINDKGICTVCEENESSKKVINDVKINLIKRTEKLFEKVKKENRVYDVLAMYSGGKDSTILIKILKDKYKLNVLAVSFIHPMMKAQNVSKLSDKAKKLGVDLIQFYQDEKIYKKFIKNAILNNEKYNLGECGCLICSFLHRWTAMRFAMQMSIPIVATGNDLTQSSNWYITSSSLYSRAKKGDLPFGRLNKAFIDIIGNDKTLGLYKFDESDLKENKFPTFIAPFTYMDYDYRNYIHRLEDLGLIEHNYGKGSSVCKLVHLFDYISYKKYDCNSFIRNWANGIRNNYPSLMQAKRSYDESTCVSREDFLILLEEYKKILFLVAESNTNHENKNYIKSQLLKIGKLSRSFFGEDTFEVLLENIMEFPKIATYLEIDLYNIV